MFGKTGTNWTLSCSFLYNGFLTDLTGAELYQSDVNSNYFGQLIDLTSFITPLSGGALRSGSLTTLVREDVIFVKKTDTTPEQPSVVVPTGSYNNSWGAFAIALESCGNGTKTCRIVMRTTGLPAGEATCALNGLIYGADFRFPLSANLSTHPNSPATGTALIQWRVTGLPFANYLSMWAYQVTYSNMLGFIGSSGIFNAKAPFPALSYDPSVVTFDVNGAIAAGGNSGAFCGVAIQGMSGTGTGGQTAGYNVDAMNNYLFLSNCSKAECYVGVISSAAASAVDFELRGQFAGVGQLLPSLSLASLAVVLALASRYF